MLFAKDKRRLAMWLFFWLLWVAMTATDLKEDSPLLRPDVWGVIDWLVSLVVFTALWLGSFASDRELQKQNRLHDALLTLRFLAQDSIPLAILFAIAAIRLSLYREEFPVDLSWFFAWRLEPTILHFPFILCSLAAVSVLARFVARIIAVLFAKYDEG